MTKTLSWRDLLDGRMPEHWAEEIDVYETQIEMRKLGRIDEKVFMEQRLRRGAYGQRYDNGRRHDGLRDRTLEFPSGDLTKGGETLWDAPGMQRIKIPFGGVTAEQLEVVAECAEEYSDSVVHVTTRQDFQFHYVHIDDTPDLMRRLASVGITSREACGNSVRNITACPVAGVCKGEAFDITPYARASAFYLLGHPDTQDFGRKFKIAFSGCPESGCGLTAIHDLGVTARVRAGDDGAPIHGFEVVIGGGLGPVPYVAQVLAEFVPVDELLPLIQAVSRVYALYGEKKNRNRARIKFLVAQLGIDELRSRVKDELDKLEPDERWSTAMADPKPWDEASREPSPLAPAADPALAEWVASNVQPQRQEGYYAATVRLPLGDLSSDQCRALADIARRYNGGSMRNSVEQNIVLRWIPGADIPALHADLVAAGLGSTGAGGITDIVSCPGTDSCKLGISSSRGLAAELMRHVDSRRKLHPALDALHIKISGCFNSCGQHHISDLGFYGVNRNVRGRRVPHFQVVLGGQWENNGGSYGLAIGAVPARRIPDAVDALTDAWLAQREDREAFNEWVKRIGKRPLKAMLDAFTDVPPYEEDPSFYVDWGDVREFTIGDIGIGECAGEVISPADFELSAADRDVFDAQVELDEARVSSAVELAYRAMIAAARGLVRSQTLFIADDPSVIVEEFRKRFIETKLFHHRFAGDSFARHLLSLHEESSRNVSPDEARRNVEEAQLFIEASRDCLAKLAAQNAS